MAIKLRALSPEEHDTLEKLASSRTAAARLVERARIIFLAHQGHRVPAIAQQLHLIAITVRTWLKRFNAAGLTSCSQTCLPPQRPYMSIATEPSGLPLCAGEPFLSDPLVLSN
jgi:Homeodomain-like domain